MCIPPWREARKIICRAKDFWEGRLGLMSRVTVWCYLPIFWLNSLSYCATPRGLIRRSPFGATYPLLWQNSLPHFSLFGWGRCARNNIFISLVFNAFTAVTIYPDNWGMGSDFHLMKKKHIFIWSFSVTNSLNLKHHIKCDFSISMLCSATITFHWR